MDEVESEDELFVLARFVLSERDPPQFLLCEITETVRIPAALGRLGVRLTNIRDSKQS